MHRHPNQRWKEVQLINTNCILLTYVSFAIRGIGFLVVTWITVVLLGGFVSMIHKPDFWRLTLITLIEILWINASFQEKAFSNMSLLSSLTDLVAPTFKQTEPNLAAIIATVWAVLALVHNVLLSLCIMLVTYLFAFGLFIATSLSIYGLVKHDYRGDTDEGRTNMYPAHNVVYVMCVSQGALFLYRLALEGLKMRIVNQVSQAYGFQDDGRAIWGYCVEIMKGCMKNPSSAKERNLMTYAIELMESKLHSSCLSGTMILDRLLTRQYSDKIKAPTLVEQAEKQTEEEIIVQQRSVIKQLLGSASSAHIVQKLFDTLDSKCSNEEMMREAAARIVDHVADKICLKQFPRGIQCISSLINSFEEYCQLQQNRLSSLSTNETTTAWRLLSEPKNDHDQEQGSTSESDSDSVHQSSSKALNGYKDLVLTGLRILWSLAGDDDNCTIISNTENIIAKIMAPTRCDLVHRAGHSTWSTMVSERSLGVMLRLIVTAKGDTRADLHKQISSDEGAITTMEKIVICKECKGGELQMKAMQILAQLCIDKTANRGDLTKMLISIFINGDNSNRFIRKIAGKTLVQLFLRTKSVASLLPKEENDNFVGDLAKILLQAGDDDTCRRSAAEILEHLCIQYTENGQYLSILKDTMIGLMPKVYREILSWLTREEGNPGYARSGTDVESQVTTNSDKEKSNRTSSFLGKTERHELHVTLLSLCVTACDKLYLNLDRILLGGGDQGECVTFSLAMKMVRLNRDLITADYLKAMKLITRMVIAAMKKLTDHDTVVERADLESLMDSLTSISETMLDLECSMVFAAGTTTIPATADTLDSLVKQARQLHIKIKNQERNVS